MTHSAPKTVLVVEDALDMRIFIKTLLETNGYRPLVAKDGRHGMVLARQHRPDLILLDVMMPEEGGANMYRRLKADPKLNAVPVVMLSAVAPQTFNHYLRMLNTRTKDPVAEPDAYIEKPPDPAHLLRVLKRLA